MNTIGLHPVYKPRDPSKHYKGIAVVVALHVLIGWGIVTGTAHDAFVKVKTSLEAVVVNEVIIPPPPPPPPPPKPVKVTEAPVQSEAPPPPFVPPPDTAQSTNSESAVQIQSSATPPPVTAPIAPPPPPVPVAPVQVGPRVIENISVACQKMVAPEMPGKALDDGIEGTVKAQALIVNGVIREVTILSGNRVFHTAVRSAMMKYQCKGEGEILATQSFTFKLE